MPSSHNVDIKTPRRMLEAVKAVRSNLCWPFHDSTTQFHEELTLQFLLRPDFPCLEKLTLQFLDCVLCLLGRARGGKGPVAVPNCSRDSTPAATPCMHKWLPQRGAI